MSRLQVESPAVAPEPQSHFVVGQDSHGWWLAIETQNRRGGLFKSRADAVQFVDFETGHRPGAVEFATTPLQLTF